MFIGFANDWGNTRKKYSEGSSASPPSFDPRWHIAKPSHRNDRLWIGSVHSTKTKMHDVRNRSLLPNSKIMSLLISFCRHDPAYLAKAVSTTPLV